MTGGTGAKVRPVVSCKGTTCQYGLLDSYALSEEIYRRFYEGFQDVALPHKFKIAVGGCPNNCVKPNLNDVGIIGQRIPEVNSELCKGCKKCAIEAACPNGVAKVVDGKITIDEMQCRHCGRCVGKCPFHTIADGIYGYKIYIGGRWGKKISRGKSLSKIFTSKEEALNVIEKAISVWSLEQSETLSYSDVRTALQNGNTLFASEVIDVLARMKDSDVSVGLVPYPMYSETQGSYAHYVDNHLNAYSVPVSVPDIDTLSDFMELYAYHSRYLVRSAWIDAYSYEFCSDADSGEMLDIILDSRTYDPAYLMFSSYEGDISSMISTGKNNLTKWTDRTAATISKSISDYVTAMSNANQ